MRAGLPVSGASYPQVPQDYAEIGARWPLTLTAAKRLRRRRKSHLSQEIDGRTLSFGCE